MQAIGSQALIQITRIKLSIGIDKKFTWKLERAKLRNICSLIDPSRRLGRNNRFFEVRAVYMQGRFRWSFLCCDTHRFHQLMFFGKISTTIRVI